MSQAWLRSPSDRPTKSVMWCEVICFFHNRKRRSGRAQRSRPTSLLFRMTECGVRPTVMRAYVHAIYMYITASLYMYIYIYMCMIDPERATRVPCTQQTHRHTPRAVSVAICRAAAASRGYCVTHRARSPSFRLSVCPTNDDLRMRLTMTSGGMFALRTIRATLVYRHTSRSPVQQHINTSVRREVVRNLR